MADLSKLVEKIKTNAELKKQFAAAVKENKVVEFCKSMGIDTTEKEIVSFIKSKKSELSDAELNAVNGGCNSSSSEQFCNALVSVGTLGTVCALSSIVKPTVEATEGNWGASCLD